MLLRQKVHQFLHWQYRDLTILIGITLVGAILRAYHLGYKPFWFDEALIFGIAQDPISEIVSRDTQIYSGPPLLLILIGLISHLGKSEELLRGIPWLAGVLSIPAMYLLGRQYLSRGGALIAALIIAIAPTQIEYSQKMSEYSLSVLLAILMLFSFGLFLEKSSWRRAGLLGTVIVVSIFTQYGLAFLILALNGVMLIHLLRDRGGRKDLLVKWIAIQGVALVAVFVVYRLSLGAQWEGHRGLSHVSSGYWDGGTLFSALRFAYYGSRDIIKFAYPGYVFTLLLYTGAVVLIYLHWRSTLILLIGLPFIVVIGAGLLRLYPYIGMRQDIFLTPLIYLVAALSFDYLLRFDLKRIFLGVFLFLLVWRAIPALSFYYGHAGNSGVGMIVEHLSRIAQPGDPIFICGSDPVTQYYFEVRFPMEQNTIIEAI
ncbi:MAG: glycosyltransferase family 39 protein, partial [Anaerolineales bacterium]